MKFMLLEIRKCRGAVLMGAVLVFIILQLIITFGLITSFDESYQMWKAMVDKNALPAYYFLYQSQKYFFYLYAIIIIATCGYLQYLENYNQTWVLMASLPVSIDKVFLAKILLSIAIILPLSAMMILINYTFFSFAKNTFSLLKSANISSTIWYSWWVHYTLLSTIPILMMHVLAFITKGRISVFVVTAIVTYGILSFLKLAPGFLVLMAGTMPLSSYLQLFDVGAVVGYSLLAVMIFMLAAKVLKGKMLEFITSK